MSFVKISCQKLVYVWCRLPVSYGIGVLTDWEYALIYLLPLSVSFSVSLLERIYPRKSPSHHMYYILVRMTHIHEYILICLIIRIMFILIHCQMPLLCHVFPSISNNSMEHKQIKCQKETV